MALLAATIIILAAIAAVAILLYAAILDIAGLVRGDLGAQSQMQQRRYDDVVGLCERIEAILEARQIGVLKFYAEKRGNGWTNVLGHTEQSGTDNQV